MPKHLRFFKNCPSTIGLLLDTIRQQENRKEGSGGMYLKIYRISIRALGNNPQITGLLLWEFVLIVMTALTILNQTLNANGRQLGHFLGLTPLAAIYLFLLVPYFTAGFLGTLGEAIRHNPLSFRSFFANGLRYFGRSYGLILTASLSWTLWLIVMGLVYIVMHILFGLALLSSLVILTAVALVLGLFVSVWILWVMNFLFVAGLKLRKAWRYAWQYQQHNRYLSLAAVITAYGGQAVLIFTTLWLTELAHTAGQFIGWFLMLFFALFWTLSFMALYSLTKNNRPKSEVGRPNPQRSAKSSP